MNLTDITASLTRDYAPVRERLALEQREREHAELLRQHEVNFGKYLEALSSEHAERCPSHLTGSSESCHCRYATRVSLALTPYRQTALELQRLGLTLWDGARVDETLKAA